MTHGIDTDFLIAVEIRDHIYHKPAERLLDRLLDNGHELAISPQTLAEFVHVVTDPRRMKEPLSIKEALARAEQWWQAVEVVRLFSDGQSIMDWISWLRQHRLGRKRLLDTILASTCASQGIRHLITNNAKDYRIFGCFEIITYTN